MRSGELGSELIEQGLQRGWWEGCDWLQGRAGRRGEAGLALGHHSTLALIAASPTEA